MRRVGAAAVSVAIWLELHEASGSLELDGLTVALAEAVASESSAGSGCLGTVLGSRW